MSTADRPTTEPRKLYAIPGWLAEEEGGTYYRSEEVDALLAEAAQGAAPGDHLDLAEVAGILAADGLAPDDAWRLASEIGEAHDRDLAFPLTLGAAPRAEGLPVAEQGPCTTECCDLQDVRHIHPASRPSDEREP